MIELIVLVPSPSTLNHLPFVYVQIALTEIAYNFLKCAMVYISAFKTHVSCRIRH